MPIVAVSAAVLAAAHTAAHAVAAVRAWCGDSGE